MLSIAFIILEVQGRAQAICSDNRRVIRECGLDQSYKTWEATLTGCHLLAHHAGVTVAEKKNQPTQGNPICTKLGRLLNYIGLCPFQLSQYAHRLVIEG